MKRIIGLPLLLALCLSIPIRSASAPPVAAGAAVAAQADKGNPDVKVWVADGDRMKPKSKAAEEKPVVQTAKLEPRSLSGSRLSALRREGAIRTSCALHCWNT